VIRTQIVLTPAESKKLISRAVLEMDSVKNALKNGLVVIHPSSSTYFLVEHITGKKPPGVWLVGMIVPKGACTEGKAQKAYEKKINTYGKLSDPGDFIYSWVFRKGKFEKGLKLLDVLREMGEGDIYIKGVNSIDSQGYLGVLYARAGAGTIGKTLAMQREKKFQTIYLAGLEKLIPTSIKAVAKDTADIVDALGMPCWLLPIRANAVTEVEALNLLTGVEAIPIAAGGVGGAEGSVMMVMKGEERDVRKAMRLVKEFKGAKLPKVHIPECERCHLPRCCFSGKKI
jgi:hypothetical protein